jgi:hypothetical protein
MMKKKISREEAVDLYVTWIVERGNPAYFVYRGVENWEDYELAEQMEDAMGEEFEIVEEE